MIRSTRKGGWGQDFGMIRYLNNWSKEFGTQGVMRFYGGDVSYVVDAFLEKSGDLCIFHYPHCKENIIQIVTTVESKIRTLLEAEDKTKNKRFIYTITVEGENPKIVTEKDFNRYGTKYPIEHELFTFNAKSEEDGGFPNLYLVEIRDRSINPLFLDVLQSSSSSVLNPVGNPTLIGKELIYKLVASKRKGEFVDDVPHLGGAHFPTNGQTKPVGMIDMQDLKEFCVLAGASNVYTKSGVQSYNDTPDIEVEDEEPELVFGKPPGNELMSQTLKQIMETSSVNMDDLFQLGISAIMALIPSDVIVEIITNVPDVAKKAAIYEKKVYIIPSEQMKDDAMDIPMLFMEDEELFTMCSEDTFPRKNTPLLPGPETQ